MSTTDSQARTTVEVDAKKRAFMAKFGEYAVAGAGMSVMLSPSLSASITSGGSTCPTPGVVKREVHISGNHKNKIVYREIIKTQNDGNFKYIKRKDKFRYCDGEWVHQKTIFRKVEHDWYVCL